MKKIPLIMIDDEPFYLELYQELLADDYRFFGATGLPAGIQLIADHQPEVLLLDITLAADNQGLEALPELRRRFPWLPIIMVTNRDSFLIAREAGELGADDYFVKSENIEQLQSMIQNLLWEPPQYEGGSEPVAVSRQMRQALRQAKKYAAALAHILITGETGVGKDLLAKYIHAHSRRAAKPFVSVNCGAIPHSLVESELFGYQKGAFTGAQTSRAGKFEAASGGTIFLDEIGDLPPEDQIKILQVIENKEIHRLGSNQPLSLDVRIIAATNAPLGEKMKAGQFREDLFYRLRQFSLHIPPLREREDDIIPLAKYFLQQAAEENETGGKHLSRSALLRLKNYHWSGNIRELKNVITEAVVSSPDREIRASHLKLVELPPEELSQYKTAKKNFERQYLKAALTRCNGNVTAAARAIGISRQALQKRMSKFRLDLKDEEKKG